MENMKPKNSHYYCINKTDLLSQAMINSCCLETSTNLSSPLISTHRLFNGTKYGFATCCQARLPSSCSVSSPSLHSVFVSSVVPNYTATAQCSHLSSCMEEMARQLTSSPNTQGQSGHCHFYHTIACILHFISMAILCLFTIQLVMKIYCMGKHFFKLKFEVCYAMFYVPGLPIGSITIYNRQYY